MDINSLIHEIINPLNIIIGSAELIKIKNKSDSNIHHGSLELYNIDKFKNIDNSFNNTENLLNQIIKQSKNCCTLLKSELINNKKDCFNIITFMDKLIEDIKNNPLFEDKNLKFKFRDKIKNSNICVNIHKSYLRIILQNLLLNAVKYSPNNDEISINIKTNNNRVIIEIINSINKNDDKRNDYKTNDDKYVSKYEVNKVIPSNNYGLSVVDKLVEQIAGKWYFNQQEKYIITNLICPIH